MFYNCPICNKKSNYISKRLYKKQIRTFYVCPNCKLIFEKTDITLQQNELRQRYSQHNNNYEDIGYRNFLLELAKPCFNFLEKFNLDKKDISCLDYGCGPTTAMQTIFEKNGFNMDSFDPIFHKNILKQYGLITCNEVIEHFEEPLKEFKKIIKLLKPNGTLAIGTFIWNEKIDIKNWNYMNDITHKSFYHIETLQYLAKNLNMVILNYSNRIIIFGN